MYNYETEKAAIFTEAGQEIFLAVRDGVHKALEMSGAITMGKAMNFATGSGSSWTMMAHVDRLVELGEIQEIPQAFCAGQHRIFVETN